MKYRYSMISTFSTTFYEVLCVSSPFRRGHSASFLCWRALLGTPVSFKVGLEPLLFQKD